MGFRLVGIERRLARPDERLDDLAPVVETAGERHRIIPAARRIDEREHPPSLLRGDLISSRDDDRAQHFRCNIGLEVCPEFRVIFRSRRARVLGLRPPPGQEK